jgi:hypothetical protein
MLSTIKGLEPATAITEPKLKIAIVGDQGVGKSWLAATAPKPVLDLDFDGRKSSLAGKEGVFVKSYVDADSVNPKAIADLESDLNTFEYEFNKGNPTPATYVIDSATYFRKFADAELVKQQSSLGRELKMGTHRMKIGQGWDITNGNRMYLEYVINRLATIGNVIVCFHTQDEKDNSKTTTDKNGNKQVAYSGRITVQPQYLASVLSIFNDVWWLDVNYANKRVVQTGISSEFIGKCSLKGLNPTEEVPDIEAMLAKHRAAIGTK